MHALLPIHVFLSKVIFSFLIVGLNKKEVFLKICTLQNNMSSKKTIENILALADVKINGSRPWDIQVHNPRLYSRILAKGSLGLGESYMDGWWDCKDLDQFFYKILRRNLQKKIKAWRLLLPWLKAKIFNLQKKSRAFQIGEKHYDIGNNLYTRMLDKRMNYSCGYWRKSRTLDKAQKDKLDLVCKKIGLKKGQKILDIGCGWGSFAKYAAEKYKAKVVGITVSKEQVKLAKKNCKGLNVEIRLQDYRELNEKFDRIISIGMFEHVGPKNHRTYMKVVRHCLTDDGLFLLHTIGNDGRSKSGDPWISKYIFPNSLVPSAKHITDSADRLFTLEDWHNFGSDYDKTLMEWNKNFTKNWDKIKNDYNDRFFRMWTYYLLCCAGSFRARHNQLWQVVFSKHGVEGGYKSIR
jgi:cyclopropane-fatty-acyl-phospholipid synthase